MKPFKIIAASVLLTAFSLSQTSCLVVHEHKHDNGKRKGWNKNPNNPHHPNTTNPGHNKGKGKNK